MKATVANSSFPEGAKPRSTVISQDSPLRRIPSDLNTQQAAFFDAIRLTGEMLDIAYVRLTDSLWDLTLELSGKKISANVAAPLFLDAWSIVDSSHRIVGLFDQVPGLKKNSPGYQVFIRKTAKVEEFRNPVQHLRGELRNMSQEGHPVLGALCWISLTDIKNNVVKSCLVTAGRVLDSTTEILNPGGKEFKSNVDHVTLVFQNRRLSLTQLVDDITGAIRIVENSLRSQFPDASSSGSDLIIATTISLE